LAHIKKELVFIGIETGPAAGGTFFVLRHIINFFVPGNNQGIDKPGCTGRWKSIILADIGQGQFCDLKNAR